jgi:group I intron endonuclease
MIGIYKITSPTNRIYIGQSVNIEKRFKSYQRDSSTQIRLNRSFIKYGIKNHKFEVIEECSIELLNERERYWQDFYNVLETGLNCKLTTTKDKSGFFSDESKKKMSLKLLGNKRMLGKNLSEATKNKISKSKKNRFKGIKKSEEHKIKIGLKQKGGANHQAKLVLCLNTGIFYTSVIEAAIAYNINRYTLSDYLNNRRGIKNKSSLIFV